MSKKSNVHPDYYKTAGRDRQDDAARERMKQSPPAAPLPPSQAPKGRKKRPPGARRKPRSPGA